MLLETDRLIIRDLKPEDETPFVEMASDGSLKDVGFNNNCSRWMGNWIIEARELTETDNPASDYLAYTIMLKEKEIVIGSIGCSFYDDLQETGITYFIGAKYRGNGYAVEAARAYIEYFFKHYDISRLITTVREENISSWKVVEKAGFELVEKKLYKDINDDKEEMYRFYEIVNSKSENQLCLIREIRKTEYPLLRDFLYEAIFVPEGVEAPPKSIIDSPELQVYIAEFGEKKDDRCFVAEVDGRIVGAVWVRIMNDYGHIDNSTPSFAISLYKEYRGFGIGTSLMKKMLSELKLCGYEKTSLAVQKANYAVRMYRKVGFEIVDENEEEYIMVYYLKQNGNGWSDINEDTKIEADRGYSERHRAFSSNETF